MSSADAELASICGEVSSPYAEHDRLIHRLPSNLAPQQLERCRAFLESPLEEQPLPDLEFNGLKNELVFALLRQREGLTELAELLVRMSRAPETDATWRDYCIQFLGKCYPRINDAKSREAMAEALWEALKTQRAGRGAGSAARQMMTLGRSFPEFPLDKVAPASLEALLDPACSVASKTALLQVCGTLGEHGALPMARDIAGKPSSPVLRASAIAAVGMLGDASDLPLLKHLAESGDIRVSLPEYFHASEPPLSRFRAYPVFFTLQSIPTLDVGWHMSAGERQRRFSLPKQRHGEVTGVFQAVVNIGHGINSI